MKAIILVDIQNDFCPAGALAVSGGDSIVNPSNKLIQKFVSENLPVVFTRDWHPADHSSFTDNGGIWPSHCVAGTPGADFHPDLLLPESALIFSKAVTAERDAYSGFEGTTLDAELKTAGVDELVICGLATDYCVKNTALDAVNLGYRVELAADCIRAVDVNPGDGDAAIDEMRKAGIIITDSKALLK